MYHCYLRMWSFVLVQVTEARVGWLVSGRTAVILN